MGTAAWVRRCCLMYHWSCTYPHLQVVRVSHSTQWSMWGHWWAQLPLLMLPVVITETDSSSKESHSPSTENRQSGHSMKGWRAVGKEGKWGRKGSRSHRNTVAEPRPEPRSPEDQSSALAVRPSPLTSVKSFQIYIRVTAQNLAHKLSLSRADNHSLGVLIRLQWLIFTLRLQICYMCIYLQDWELHMVCLCSTVSTDCTQLRTRVFYVYKKG